MLLMLSQGKCCVWLNIIRNNPVRTPEIRHLGPLDLHKKEHPDQLLCPSLPLPVTPKNDTDPDTIPDIVSCFEMADAKHTTVPISPVAQLSKTTAIPLDTASLP